MENNATLDQMEPVSQGVKSVAAICDHAKRVFDRMVNTPHGPKRTRLAQQHVELLNQALRAEGWNAAILQSDQQQAELLEKADAMDWLSTQTRLELTHYSPVYGDDDDQSDEWRVHNQSGPINDREWALVASGETASDAVIEARTTLRSNGNDQG